MAGRIAEEVFFGKENVTVGAQNDIEKATILAVDYISSYGMDEDSGFINFSVLSQKLNIPLASVEKSVKELSREIYEDTLTIVRENKDKVSSIAKKLMEKEVINEEELVELMN
jgi:cell division protease FtsH